MEFIKTAVKKDQAVGNDQETRATVEGMLKRIELEGESAVAEYAKTFDGWTADFVLTNEKLQQLIDSVPQDVKDDIDFAHKQIKRFAEAQRNSLTEFSIETEEGVTLGQKVMPVQAAGCYVPGGRYAHAASALMSVATAKAAGVPNVIACSPPRGESINAAVAYAMHVAGADIILDMGGARDSDDGEWTVWDTKGRYYRWTGKCLCS